MLAFKEGDKAFFMFGFAKSQQENIDKKELKALKLMAKRLLGYTKMQLTKAINQDEIIEVEDDG